MIPDLGKYAFTVLSAYGVSLMLLIGLIGLTLRQSGQVRRALNAQEQRRIDNG